MICLADFGAVNAVNLAVTMETEVPIELAEYESLERDGDGLQRSLPTANPAARVLSPDEMIGIKWWLEDWYMEWKTLANIRNDTDFLIRSQMTTNLKLSFNPQIESLPSTQFHGKKQPIGTEQERNLSVSNFILSKAAE